MSLNTPILPTELMGSYSLKVREIWRRSVKESLVDSYYRSTDTNEMPGGHRPVPNKHSEAERSYALYLENLRSVHILLLSAYSPSSHRWSSFPKRRFNNIANSQRGKMLMRSRFGHDLDCDTNSQHIFRVGFCPHEMTVNEVNKVKSRGIWRSSMPCNLYSHKLGNF